MFQQIPFEFKPREINTFESYIVGENHITIEIVKNAVLGLGEKQLYLWGEKNIGKTHIMHSACNLASAKGYTSIYLPFKDIIHQPAHLMEELEHTNLICIDDLQAITGNADWETVIFNLINRVRDTGNILVVCAKQPPDQIEINLKDLQSRLTWGPVFKLVELTDDEKRNSLKERARSRGLEIPDNVTSYLLNHYPRDLFGLFEKLDELDTASMSRKRRLTVPFVKTVLSSNWSTLK